MHHNHLFFTLNYKRGGRRSRPTHHAAYRGWIDAGYDRQRSGARMAGKNRPWRDLSAAPTQALPVTRVVYENVTIAGNWGLLAKNPK